jgi:hypothetical protein
MTESVPDDRRRSPSTDDDERSPDNVAPAVAYLASDRSDWCNGQVISARGYQIGLYNVPQIIREIVSPGSWDLDVAFRMIEASFRPAAEGRLGRSPAQVPPRS